LGRRKSQVRGASQTGCRPTETHPARTTTAATKKPPKKPTTHPNLTFHYQCFWPPNRSWGDLSALLAVEKRRRLSNLQLHCRNMLKSVETGRKLSNRWPRANNTRKGSSNGLPKPDTASHNGTGKSPRRKPARFAPSGPRSKSRLPMGKAWRASGSGSKRMAESSSQCKAWAPTLHASGGKKRPNQFRQLSLLHSPQQAKPRGGLPTRTPRTTFGKAPRKNAGSSIRPVPPTKAS
jgi:hypothetical protein